MSLEITEIVGSLLDKVGLTSEQKNLADSEILSAMLGLQTLESAIKNISQISGKSADELSVLQKELQERVFDVFEKMRSMIEIEKTPPEQKIKSSAETLPEIPPEDLPTVTPGETAHDVEIKPTTDDQQQTTRTESPKSQTPTYYPQGQDPYREPVE